MTYYLGYSCRDIAQIMDCPVETVKTRMFYARRRLRALLGTTPRGGVVSGRVLPFEGSQHREAERLLPWLVNGPWTTTSARWSSAHVDGCVDCRSELAQLRALQRGLRRSPHGVDADAAIPRRRSRLAPPARAAAAAACRPSACRGGAPCARVDDGAALAALARWPRSARCCWCWRAPGGREQPPTPYRTLGDLPAAAGSAGKLGHGVRSAPGRGADAQLLRASQARIVDGPNEAGAYVLAVPAARLASVRDALRAAPGVTLVESLGPDASRQ